LKLAEALQQYSTPEADYGLVVDDVLTTGGSIRRFLAAENITVCRVAVVFARGELLPGAYALFQMPRELWLAEQRSGE
jgi:orotate phosphoribosyltransferase